MADLMKSPMSDADLIRFLLAAKRATYAAQGDEASVAPLLPDSRQLEFRQGDFFYRDIYVGMLHFVGQEIVYAHDRAIWSMSYSGGLCAQAGAAPVYAFLRQALRNAPADMPLRGPALFDDGSMRYTCASTGSIEQFHGIETITQNGTRLYELHFSGGSLQ